MPFVAQAFQIASLLATPAMGAPADAPEAPIEAPAESPADVVAQVNPVDLVAGQAQIGSLAGADARLDSGEYVDYYTFVGRAGQEVEISATSTDFDTYLMLRGTTLSEDNDDRAPGEDINALLRVTLPETGNYIVGVTSYAPGESGRYTVELTDLGGGSLAEPANPVAAVTAGETESGTLDASDGAFSGGRYAEAVSIEATAGEQLTVSLLSNDFDTFLVVNGPDGFSVSNDDAPGMGLNSRVTFTAPSSGTYTAIVTSYGAGATGEYSLRTTRADERVEQPRRDDITPIAAGETVRERLRRSDGQLQSGEFRDRYAYQGSAGERLTITMTSSQFDPYLFVRGADGFAHDNDDDGTGALNSRLDITLPEDGEYLIVATSYAPGETGSYELTVSAAGMVATTAGGLTAGDVVRAELDGTEPVRGGGQHYRTFTFEGRRGQRARIDLSSEAFDTWLAVQMPTGLEQTNDDIGNGILDSRLIFTLPADGTYEVVASSYGRGEVGAFDLGLTLDDVPSTPPDVAVNPGTGETPTVTGGGLAFDVPVQGALDAGDSQLQSGEYTESWSLEGEAGAGLTLTMESDAFDTYLMIRGPGGFSLDNDDGPSMGLNSQLEVTLPQTGVYTITATSYAPGETGPYTITMTEGTRVQQNARGQVYAIFAGITAYQSASQLPYCAEDAVKLDESLAGTGLLANSIVLTDRQVTRAGLQEAISTMASQVGPDDVFFFFYSGHGDRTQNAAELDGYDETLYVMDGNITDDELVGWLDAIDARMEILALDSCFSGGFLRDFIVEPNRMGIFSSEEDVTSLVASNFQAGGYLSYFLRNGFEGAADIAPVDGIITAGELAQYLRLQWDENGPGYGPETSDAETAWQNLVVDRGAVKVSDVIVYTPSMSAR